MLHITFLTIIFFKIKFNFMALKYILKFSYKRINSDNLNN